MMDDLLRSARDPFSQDGGDAGDVQERWLHLLDLPTEVPEGG
jgi:hypothetical protein